MPEAVPTPEQVRAALEELLGWRGISRSPQLADLLSYVVEKTLGGEAASIKAYSIAVDVFGRPQSFDPQSDPIVRVQARRLRMLLNEYFESGQNQCAVRIALPVGRYVPEFTLLTAPAPRADPPAPEAPQPVTTQPPHAFRTSPPPGFWSAMFYGMSFTILSAALAVLIVQFFFPRVPLLPAPVLPEPPQLYVGGFDNLTGNAALDDAVAGISQKVSEGLSRFESIIVIGGAQPRDGLVLKGTVQERDGRFEMRAILTEVSTGGISWSTTIAPGGADVATALLLLGDRLVRRLAGPGGPLHAPGRAWLAAQTSFPTSPNLYVCELQFAYWRDVRTLDEALDALGCFQQILGAEPDNAIAIAANASVASWRAQDSARPGDELVALLFDEAAATERAVALSPNSSFVHEQRGLVLARQGFVPEAIAAEKTAMTLNPSSTDAIAIFGLLTALDGNWAEGAQATEDALTDVPSAPPWYYLTRGLNALREQRFFDAVDAGQTLAAGDPDLGPVIVLAAAPSIARQDLVDRYKALVLGNANLQQQGILPRVSIYLRQEVLFERIRSGLILAGLPANTLDHPFNPDGTARRLD